MPRIRGVVRQCVLVADVVRHLLADVVHVFDAFREIGDAARRLGDILQRPPRSLGTLFALLAEQSNRVDHCIGLLDIANGFFQGVMTRIVFAVGNNQQDMFVFSSFLQMVKRADDSVVKRRTAA